MKSTILWTLAGLNILLLAGFISRYTGENEAQAQGAVRRPAEYLMIPGEVIGGTNAVVYVIDTSNGQLGAISFDETRNVIDAMPPIDLTRVFEAAATPAGGPGNRRR